MDASSLAGYKFNKLHENKYRALLIGQYGSSAYPDKEQQEESLRELSLLSDTAAIRYTYELFFKISRPDPANFLTSGIITEVESLVQKYGILFIYGMAHRLAKM